MSFSFACDDGQALDDQQCPHAYDCPQAACCSCIDAVLARRRGQAAEDNEARRDLTLPTSQAIQATWLVRGRPERGPRLPAALRGGRGRLLLVSAHRPAGPGRGGTCCTRYAY